ncbi:CysH 3'-phosphoadenosine 5'-phosphosulfate sulfotransferase (PAPS reductase)/FAD synthetase and related enzymes [uncultured Caudovirales phage]|uniref:CysH 3'-phosphoadenosine 5'-phosphosulfate sulfotransferase (PAPS reductase)/FAD synthetase and related enzymes n=1 Tax=uncultured Caudovirales phage TaxID=2100421 RepID=A0A6J5SSQ0_9CAUD|nr:CysH 3'-phosphoadenosine 5'-phosphosulfate sulfotransferase (PAPS reductase)/FAD synthetase and related enzymes [uncultured Caudovirales phage]
MKKSEQLNIFGTKRMTFDEQVALTVQSMNTYGPLHDHWAAAWSWGKDSTALITLIVYLMESGKIPKPKSFTILCADTRMELIPLWVAAKGIISKMNQLGIDVKVVTAPLDDRFMVYILGRGVPPPSNRFRWCTPQIKIEPMEEALSALHSNIGQKILMLTGVRQGESAIRDGRIAMSCSKDGAECGQGWYQTGLDGAMCSTLAPILHWRVCNVWDWLKLFAPSQEFGGWPTAILADAYGGDEAEEINARTGCIGCPLASKDKALESVVKIIYWNYLSPLKELKIIYREMRLPKHRRRQPGGQRNKDGKLSKNQQRLGPLTIESRMYFLDKIIDIQKRVNEKAQELNRPMIDILNEEEISRIKELMTLNTYPDGWTGDEPTGDIILDKKYSDGSTMEYMFRDMVRK